MPRSRPSTISVAGDSGLRVTSPAGRWVVASTVLGSAVVMLDSTVVNVALPSIGRDLHAGIDGLQWTLSAYLLTLSSLILLGGALGDQFGRRRLFIIGVMWFASASLLCGLAPNLELLIAARAIQGIGGALLTPGSLAIIQASFHPDDRSLAIGAWSGLGGVAVAIGPFLGGYLVQTTSWRLIFLLNLPLALAVVLIALRHVPESADPHSGRGIDLPGAILAVLGLGGCSFALIEAPGFGPTAPLILASAAVGVGALVLLGLVEARSRAPMLPLELFRSRCFVGANLVTLAVYGALSAVLFLLVVQLQQVVGYAPLQAGAATFPVTVLMLVLSPRAGQLAQRIGPRLPMTVGPLVAAGGMALMRRIGPGAAYPGAILPALVVFGLGLSLTVAPLTSTVMAAVEERHAGVASAINNALARAAGLVAVAVLPPLAGITGDAYLQPSVFAAGFAQAALIGAVLCASGGLIAWLSLGAPPRLVRRRRHDYHCALDAPPLRPAILVGSEPERMHERVG